MEVVKAMEPLRVVSYHGYVARHSHLFDIKVQSEQSAVVILEPMNAEKIGEKA